MGPFPALAGQSSDYIVDRLTTYKNKGQVGAMSSTMWAQAGMLSEQDIETIGKFIEETL
jgi:cytochrome c553